MNSGVTISAIEKRIIVVSNRLPVTGTVKSIDKDRIEWCFKMSSGGLVAGLEGVKKKFPFLWIGWPGMNIPDEFQRRKFEDQLYNECRCVPVFLEDQLADEHYNGFSNGVLWPLFHYQLEESGSNFSEKLWISYVEANKRFASIIESVSCENDLIWIHDYHLMQVAQVLRKRNSKVRIGFFLHIPFPSSEIFQALPVRKAILTGLLHCDLLGFHTYDYARHFLSSCSRILGLETTPGGVTFENRFVPVGVFPIGIDSEKFAKELRTEKVAKLIEIHRRNFHGKKILLAVDRLDYIKGIPHRMMAYARFLEKYPEFQGKVVLVQVAVPSRTEVEEYKRLKHEVDALVGHINGNYGTIGSNPIHYLYQSVPFAELCALYAVSDVAMVTSIRDGMNLVAQEFIACQNQNHGVLILSEFTGSAPCLFGALLVNPWNTEEVANTIYEALTMSEVDRSMKHATMANFVTSHNASRWGESFMKELDRISCVATRSDEARPLNSSMTLFAFREASDRLLIFSSDGALIPFASLPFLATPSTKILKILETLSQDPRNTIYILSGRDRTTLSQWFGSLKLGLVAEHGFFMRHVNSNDQWLSLESEVDLSWKRRIIPVFQDFTERTPGSFFEEKETGLTWHFRSSDRQVGLLRAQELHSMLDTTTFPANVILGEKTVDVRPYGCNYTSVLKRIMKFHENFSFMLYIGEPVNIDFSNDSRVFACGIGKMTRNFYVKNTEEVVKLLESLCRCTNVHSPS